MKRLILFAISVFSLSSTAAVGPAVDIQVIAHLSQDSAIGEKEVRDLYLGKLKMRQIELIDQSEGQPARNEFVEKFLNKSETELKQQRSILVFSGHRIPAVLTDDMAVLERVKMNQKAIGYVSSEFAKKHLQNSSDIKVLFTVK